MMDRRSFVSGLTAAGVSATFAEAVWNQAAAAPPGAAAAAAAAPAAPATPIWRPAPPITPEMLKAAEQVIGVRHTDAERGQMIERIESDLKAYGAIRAVAIPNSVAPPLRFSPLLPGRTPSPSLRDDGAPAHSRPVVRRPALAADIAFLSVLELAELIRTRRLTSTELTHIYLNRLRRYDPQLRCVVNLTPDLALRLAAEADREIAAGAYRGPLHGIPYGVKDILSVPDYPTTWGAAVYKNRVLDTTATVVERLEAAGAVLVAKLSLGELGLSDTWYRGQTMDPWKPTLGAYGSSAGSAAAVAAGLVAFAIGEETMGSIIRPASRSGVTGLRPTFGRVSRHGAMTLCWSLDKLGPMAREVEDCAVVLEAIAGPDGKDPTVTPVAWQWVPDVPLSSIRVGYFKWAFDEPHSTKPQDDAALASLRTLGAQPVEVEMPADLPVNAALLVRVEAAAALDEIDKVHGLQMLAVQDATGWPNFMRASRFVPAVEYLQANRIRTLLMERMERVFEDVDVFIAPTFGVLTLTNLTGHPAVVLPSGLSHDGLPTSVSFVGKLYGESALCTVARAWQDLTGFHRLRPAAFAD